MVHNILIVKVLQENNQRVLLEREIEINNALQFPFEKTIEVLKMLYSPTQVIINFSCSSYISKN